MDDTRELTIKYHKHMGDRIPSSQPVLLSTTQGFEHCPDNVTLVYGRCYTKLWGFNQQSMLILDIWAYLGPWWMVEWRTDMLFAWTVVEANLMEGYMIPHLKCLSCRGKWVVSSPTVSTLWQSNLAMRNLYMLWVNEWYTTRVFFIEQRANHGNYINMCLSVFLRLKTEWKPSICTMHTLRC